MNIDPPNGRRDAPISVVMSQGRTKNCTIVPCLETSPILLIYHSGVTSATVNLSADRKKKMKLRQREWKTFEPGSKYPVPS